MPLHDLATVNVKPPGSPRLPFTRVSIELSGGKSTHGQLLRHFGRLPVGDGPQIAEQLLVDGVGQEANRSVGHAEIGPLGVIAAGRLKEIAIEILSPDS